jgi:NAD(P)-dependent dehydrogenase (short-subunit alcohol dehydrogenase family)
MQVRLKDVKNQVMVLTGASSGIGLVTARMAARQGAKLVLAARSSGELHHLTNEITSQGGEAIFVVADVGREEEVLRIAEAAVQRFGGFDTWVNNAGVSIFGRLEEVQMPDFHRLFETNFWGVVYGSLIAVRHLKKRGGALINVGSVVSDRAFPLQGMYSASKHAVKGFTDALRLELEEEGAPVSVTLIKPTAIATPFARHARNYLPVEPTLPPPIYAPELVAQAILHCAENPVRDMPVGTASKVMSMAAAASPRLMDKYQESTSFHQQQTDQPARRDRAGNLHRPTHDLAERGQYARHIVKTSAYNTARMHPFLTAGACLGAGLAIGGIWAALQGQGRSEAPSHGGIAE